MMILTYVLALYYAFYTAQYAVAAIGYAVKNPKVMSWGSTAFPVMASRNYEPSKQAVRLLQVALLAGATGWCLWFKPQIGLALALYVSAYEVYMSWGFYRRAGTLTTKEGMTRLTLHAALCGLLLTEAFYAALGAWFPRIGS